ESMVGVCGATADTVAARNLARIICAGVSTQIEEARRMTRVLIEAARGEGACDIADEKELSGLAGLLGLPAAEGDRRAMALAVGERLYATFGSQGENLPMMRAVPPRRRQVWDGLGVTPRSLDREVVELMHRTHMGVDQEFVNITKQTSRCALVDGWGASRIIDRLDRVLCPPMGQPTDGGRLRADAVNILVLTQTPLAMAALRQACGDGEITALLAKSRAASINLVAGSIGNQEADLRSGLVEVLVAEGSCIIPATLSMAIAAHTRVVAGSPAQRMAGAEYLELSGARARENAKAVLKMAIAAFARRQTPSPFFTADVARLPAKPVEGIDKEALAQHIRQGGIRGIALLIGCGNHRQRQDIHRLVVGRLLRENILVAGNGCAVEALLQGENGQEGSLMAEAGDGLQAACKELGVSPVLSMGACADSSRLLAVAGRLLDAGLGEDFPDLPLAVAAPAWIGERIAATGQCLVASGIDVFFGQLPVTGSRRMADYLQEGCRAEYGACWHIEQEPGGMAEKIVAFIEYKRQGMTA
ncbi:MAG: hypothetical protein ABIK12_10815, partial [Pseudomonadota bacterium]